MNLNQNQNQESVNQSHNRNQLILVIIPTLVTALIVGVVITRARSEANYYKERLRQLEFTTGEQVESEADFEEIWERHIQQAKGATRPQLSIYRLGDEEFRANAADTQVPLAINTSYVIEMDLSASKYADHFTGTVEIKYPRTLSANDFDFITISGVDEDGSGFDGMVCITTKNSYLALDQESVEGYDGEIRDGKFYAVIRTKEIIAPSLPKDMPEAEKANEL